MSNSTTADPDGGDPDGNGPDSTNPLGGALAAARRSLDPVLDPLISVLVTIRRSFLAFIIAVGVTLIVLGVPLDGLFAGMFGIWGATALICAAVGFVAVKVLKLLDA